VDGSTSPTPAPVARKGAGVLLVVSYVAALLFPIVGVIFAIVLLVRRQFAAWGFPLQSVAARRM
jgi:hypothetical protein